MSTGKGSLPKRPRSGPIEPEGGRIGGLELPPEPPVGRGVPGRDAGLLRWGASARLRPSAGSSARRRRSVRIVFFAIGFPLPVNSCPVLFKWG